MRAVRRLALALAILAGPALAAVARPTSVESLARSADAVIRGQVSGQWSRWAGGGRRIFTSVQVTVSEVWKGAAPPLVRIEVPGGAVGDIAQHVDAAPAFDDGEEVVVFLDRRGDDWQVHGLALGTFRVEGDEARPGLEAFRFAPGEIPAGEREVGRMPLAELERRVRASR